MVIDLKMHLYMITTNQEKYAEHGRIISCCLKRRQKPRAMAMEDTALMVHIPEKRATLSTLTNSRRKLQPGN